MTKGFYCPEGYKSILSVKDTEKAIKLVRDFFQLNLSSELKLRRVTAPLFVKHGTGINDDLNGIEKPVCFDVKDMPGTRAEIVHSLAKWKRMMLADLRIGPGYGLYTDMNAIRPDEFLDNLHSLYVDQWDWEQHILPENRNLEYLKKVVKKIYEALKRTEYLLFESFPDLQPSLPEEITFIHTEELLHLFPELSPVEREHRFARDNGAVFIIGVGGVLSNGNKHDGRAADYDDWSTPNTDGFNGLNGDIIIWNPVLNTSLEVSSMGIRVDKKTMIRQLEIENQQERKDLFWHKRLLNGEFPLSIGGGIGQSRLCMLLLRKAHIGEIQSSIWPEEMVAQCNKNGMFLL